MITALILITIAIILSFGFVVLFGAPYLPTLKKQTEEALDLLDLKHGQTMLELGCGDGRMLSAAADRGWRVIGYEINPLLVVIARLSTWKHRRRVKVVWGDFWRADWPPTEGIYTFLLSKYMDKLHKKVVQEANGKPIKLVSFAFKIPGQKVVKEKDGLFLYQY